MMPLHMLDHHEYACRAAAVIVVGCVLAFLIGYFVSDREADDE